VADLGWLLSGQLKKCEFSYKTHDSITTVVINAAHEQLMVEFKLNKTRAPHFQSDVSDALANNCESYKSGTYYINIFFHELPIGHSRNGIPQHQEWWKMKSRMTTQKTKHCSLVTVTNATRGQPQADPR
jgi:hypothetical protein